MKYGIRFFQFQKTVRTGCSWKLSFLGLYVLKYHLIQCWPGNSSWNAYIFMNLSDPYESMEYIYEMWGCIPPFPVNRDMDFFLEKCFGRWPWSKSHIRLAQVYLYNWWTVRIFRVEKASIVDSENFRPKIACIAIFVSGKFYLCLLRPPSHNTITEI